MIIDANLIEGFKIGVAAGFIIGFCLGCWIVYMMKMEGKLK